MNPKAQLKKNQSVRTKTGKAWLLDLTKILFGGLGAALLIFLVEKYTEKDPFRTWAENFAQEKFCKDKGSPEEIVECAEEIALRIDTSEESISQLNKFEDIPKEEIAEIEESLNNRQIDQAWTQIGSLADTYDHSLFPHWQDRDNDCQSTRDEKLIEASLIVPVLEQDGCRVKAGLWKDPYTGDKFRNPRDLDIDHIVPLKEAWLRGAYKWTDEERAKYANDLNNLIVASAQINRVKGLKTPADWLPPNSEFVCDYVLLWSAIKLGWALSAEPEERKAVRQTVATRCMK